jgi:xanthine dehydrogenase accessory factor
MNIFRKAWELQENNISFAMATIIKTNGSVPRKDTAKMIVTATGETFGTIGGGNLESKIIRESTEAIRKGKSKEITYHLDQGEKNSIDMICGGSATLFIEVSVSRREIILLGAGHINYALSKLIDFVGLSYRVIDNAPEMADEERFPQAKEIITSDFTEGLKKVSLTNKYVIIATRGHENDNECLENLLGSEAVYIGMIGSRKKVAVSREKMKARGYEKELEKLFAPVGLDIGGSTPEEIAVSIISEIMKEMNKGTGKNLRDLL